LVELRKGKGKPTFVPCESFSEASIICGKYISALQLGGSNFTGGTILHPVKGKFARVSYNGRVWKGTNAMSYDEIRDLNTNDY
jgi:hypothetical protein